MKEPNGLSKTQFQTYKMLFSMIDKDCDEKITINDIKSTFRDLNLAIEESKIQDCMPKELKSLDFNQFITLVLSKFTGFSEESELKDAFDTFLQTDSIDSKSLRDCITNTLSDNTEKEAVSAVIEEFTKKNNVTGVAKFKAEEFIDKIK